MKRVLPLLLLLTGCISTEPTAQQTATNAKQCSAYGYKRGTNMHANCELYLAQQSRQQNQNRLNAFGDAVSAVGDGLAGAAAYSPPPAPVQPFHTFGAPQTVIVQPATPTLSQTVNSMPRYQ